MWAMGAVVLSVDRGFGGLLTFWLHSLLPHFPAIIIVVVAAVDGIGGMHHYRQTSWHIWKVLLMSLVCAMVEQRLQEVVIVGGSGDEAEVGG